MSEQCSLCSTIPSVLVSPERSSRVAELISNNIPPSQSDRQFMQSLCIDYEDRIRQLNDRVSRMAEALAVLTTERDKFLAHIEDTKAIMHPMRSVPDDILYEIFSHCIPNWTSDNLRHGQCNPHDSLDVKNEPWTLGQVCSRWRNVVLQLPSLWSTVVLHFPKYRSKDQDHLLARLRLLLERSRACDLTVIAATDYVASFGIENPLIALLRQTSHRWKYLRIWLSLAFMRGFFQLLPVNRLQQLAIHNGTMDQADAPYLTEPVKLDSAYQLNNVRLSGRRPANLNVTWAHIVDFDAINVFCEHIFSALPQMVNVRSMKLACGPTRCPPGARPISLHRLKRLKLEEQTPGAGGCIASFLSLLDAPILSSLHLLYPREFATPRLPQSSPALGG
ncbi:hypothetical protein CPB85DRAFT_1415353 [Mucidula mucida]|nr:hypothetical protein CPB85DRAFT_1415353 [Mucidula mucida]